VVHYLASTPSRLLVISMEDALGSTEQVNVPGTVDEHPNWRRRLPVDLEDLKHESGLVAAATILRTAGRGVDCK
jgi:4-alpha-glucanotransferase